MMNAREKLRAKVVNNLRPPCVTYFGLGHLHAEVSPYNLIARNLSSYEGFATLTPITDSVINRKVVSGNRRTSL